MEGSHVEEGGEQVQGKDSGPSTRARKDKSRDDISSLEGRFVRLELGVADTKEGMGLLEQSMEKAVEDLKVQKRHCSSTIGAYGIGVEVCHPYVIEARRGMLFEQTDETP